MESNDRRETSDIPGLPSGAAESELGERLYIKISTALNSRLYIKTSTALNSRLYIKISTALNSRLYSKISTALNGELNFPLRNQRSFVCRRV